MIILDADEVREIYTVRDAITVMGDALRRFATGKVTQPLRTILSPETEQTLLAVMPCHIAELGYGVKILTLNPDNPARGMESIVGTVLVYDPETGGIKAIVDGGAVTAIRTAAVSAVATDVLATEAAGDLAILGSGTQARTHLDAMAQVRKLRRIRCWSRSPANAQIFQEWARTNLDLEVELSPSVQAAVDGADLVCTTTASTTPLIKSSYLSSGAHVNAIGASVRGQKELEPGAVARCSIFVDSTQSALTESSDICDPLTDGLIQGSDIKEIGDVLLGTAAGRVDSQEITLFKSLGLAVEDVASGFFIAEHVKNSL